MKETIHYVYKKDGKKAHEDSVQTVNLTKQVQVYAYQNTPVQNPDDIPWSTATIDTVPSPTIKGYTPDIPTVPAYKVDGNSKDKTVTVTYKKNAPKNVSDSKKVTETIHYKYTDGKQAAKDFQQTVNLTRQSKQDTETDEITWSDWSTATIPAVVSPTIKGYTPDIATVDAFNVDGNSTDKTVNVVYTKNNPKEVTYSKAVTETVHYVYSDGTKASDDFVKTVTLKRTGEQDPVTDEITWGKWNTAIIPEVPSPVINGYTPDKASVAAVNVSGTTPAEITVTVTYTKNNTPTQPTGPQPTEPSNPTQPTQPNPTQPTEPNNPTQPTQPNPTQPTEPNNPTQPTQPKGQTSETPKQPDQPTEPTQPTQPKGENNEPTPVTPVVPQNPDNPVTPATPATPTKPAQPVAENDQLEPQQPKSQANKLPQTGNDSNAMSIVGIAIASALAMLGISDKRQHD